MASPPLQEEEVVAPLRHPELQGVLQEDFLRVQPHIFQKGGPRAISVLSLLAAGALTTCLGARARAVERRIGPHCGGFAGWCMAVLPRRQLQGSGFASSPHGRFTTAGGDRLGRERSHSEAGSRSPNLRRLPRHTLLNSMSLCFSSSNSSRRSSSSISTGSKRSSSSSGSNISRRRSNSSSSSGSRSSSNSSSSHTNSSSVVRVVVVVVVV